MDRDDASVSPPAPASNVTSASTSTSTSPTAPLATPVAATAAPLSRSVSQQSAASSTRSHRSVRGSGPGSRRASSRVPTRSSSQNPPALASSSASTTSEDNKSLTSFPSFSPKAPSPSSCAPGGAPLPRAGSRPRLAGPASSTASLVDSLLLVANARSTSPPSSSSTSRRPLQSQQSQPLLLPVTGPSTSTASTSSVTAAAPAVSARSALFEDAPPLPSSHVLPGALHLADDAHVARLIGKHGAVSLVRQLAEDLALRDTQVAALRARAADRERCLRKIILECGLSSLDLEMRLRTLEQEQEARLQSQAAVTAHPAASISSSHTRRVSDLVSDAMSDDNSLHQASSDYYYNDATIRAASAAASTVNKDQIGGRTANTGTSKGWKDFLFGGGNTAKKASSSSVSSSSASGDIPKAQQRNNTAVRVTPSGDRRPTITDDFFQPPLRASDADDGRTGRSASRTSSVNSAATSQSTATQSARKLSLASLALRLAASGNSDASQTPSGASTPGGRAGLNAASAAASLRTASGAANRKPGPPSATIGRSTRAVTLQGGGSVGPKSLMSMRRTTSSAINGPALNGLSPRKDPGRSHGSGSGGGHHHGGNSNNSVQTHERWGEMKDASPANDGMVRGTNYFPVEMDTILPLDVQPPTLTHMYNRYNSSGHLIDRFGFIYDQRRKKRQREAAQVARHIKRGSRHSEMLATAGGRSSRNDRPSPTLLPSGVAVDGEHGNGDDDNEGGWSPVAVLDDDRASSGDSNSFRGTGGRGSGGNDNDSNNRPPSPPTSLDDSVRESLVAVSADNSKDPSGAGGGSVPKRWQDYLKIATFPTELLSHTPAMSDSRIEVITEGSRNIEGGDGSSTGGDGSSIDVGPRSPGFISSDGRGFVPPTTGAMAAATTAATTTTSAATTSTSRAVLDTDSIASGTTEATTDDASQRQTTRSMNTPSDQLQRERQKNPPKEDVEPVRLLLQQLSELHDNLQKERTVRWNEFLRKVRAERRREGELAAGDHSTAVMPETRLADGEIIGVAGLGNKGKLGRAKWNEFRTLVLGGIPVVLRAKVWSECTGATSLRVPGAYDDLVAGRGGPDSDEEEETSAEGDADGKPVNGHPSQHRHREDRADVVTQIQADIHRTLTDNIFFREGPGTAKLNEVLLAYARRNPDVGYCQGMNLIAANLLLVMPSAEDAFWLLASIVETILPVGYYDQSLAASRADQQVLRAYVADVLSRLSAHFDNLGIDLETMTFQWFLSVFTDCLSAEALFRVWDVVFCLGDGSVFLFQVALALLKLNEAALLRCETPAEIYTYINHQMTNHAISIDGLIQASEALRKLVRREDVEVRRLAAMDAERALVAARAAAVQEAKASRQQKIAAREAAAAAEVAEAAGSATTTSTATDVKTTDASSARI